MIRLKVCFTLTINVIILLVSIKDIESSTDPLKVLGCDFINDTCDWESNTLSLGAYSYPLHFDQPDRTFKGQPLKGNYIWSKTGGQLKSSLISPGEGQFCISFDYYMFGFDVGTVKLDSILINKNSQKVDSIPIWSRSGSNYDGWSEQSLTIDLNPNYFTILQFTITSAGIFLGPLRVSSGSCIKTIGCSFNDFSSCNWFIEPDVDYPNFKWTIKDEKFVTASNLTSNKYLVTSNVLVNSPASTRFISENIFSSWSTQCLKFNIFKPDNKRDRVQIFYSFNNSSLVPIWSSNSIESQRNWVNVKIPLQPSGQSDDYKIMIVGDKYLESKVDSFVAIDDLDINFKSCASELNCDFSENTCGYFFSQNSFLLGYGRLPDSDVFTSSFSKVFSNSNMFLYNIPTSKTSDYVLTSPTLPSSKATCLQFRLFFSQSSHNNAYAQVMINYVSSLGESMSQSVSQFNSDQLEKHSDTWTQYKVTLANEEPFSVSFLFHGSKSFFAIDDIKFENGLCHRDSDIPSTIGTVHLSENFDDEVSQSNWLVNTWKHKHKFDSRFDRPIVDATHKYFGGYIYIDSTHSQQEAIITSKKFNGLGPYCLSLSYWCLPGNNKLSIQLNNLKLESNETIYVRDCIGNDDDWKNLEKSFLMNNDFQISIVGSSEDSKLAVDEVSLRIGSCSLQAKDSIECTFEADVYCPLEVEPSMHQLWKVSSGHDLSIETEDKTTESKKGSVIALEFPFAPNNRDTSYFFIPLTKHSGINCLQFSYKVDCDCSLSTWIADQTSDSSKIKPFYSMHYNLGLRWYQKRIALMMNSSHKIIFGGSYEPSSHGSIVLDDISIKAGTCESEYTCDFESECLWNTLSLATVLYIDQPSMQLTVDSEWTIGMPNASYTNQYPPIDYTFYDDKGSYIYTLNEKGASVLASQPFSIPKGTQYVCLSFAYSLPYNNSYPKSRLEIYLHYLDGSISVVRQLTPTKSTYSYSPWSFAKLSIQIDSKHQDNVLFLYIIANGPGPKSIDDINLNIGHCEEKTLYECGNNEKITVSSVCDFITDCKNGKDEVNCGDCTFDGSKCGYSSNDWDITNGYANFVPSPFSNVIAALTSPVISHSSSSCLLSFEYKTEFVDTLTVEILTEHREALKIWFNSNYQNSSVDHWTSSQVSIGRISHSFRISFNPEIGNSKVYPTISIRNVKLLNCGYDKTIKTEKQFICKDGVRVSLDKKCDGSFDCPKGEDEVSCSYMIYNFEDDSLNNDWLSTSHSISKWEIVTGSDQIEIRPSRDHTTGSSYGHFAFLPYITSDSTVETYFFGPMITNTVGCAITFYFNNPNPAFSLRLVIKNSETNQVLETLTEVTGQNDFKQHTIRIDSILMRPPFHLNFIGVQSSHLSNEYENDAKYIALDDIIFSDKCYSSLPDASKKAKPSVTCRTDQFTCAEDFSCIDKMYVCNGKFECPYGSDEANCGSCEFNSNDFCSWLSTGSNQWVLIKPQEACHNFFPSIDGSDDTSGQYLSIKNKNSDGTAILKSPVLFSTRNECVLNFRYFLPSHGPHLMIKLVKNSLEKTLDTLNPRGDDFRWRSGSVSLGGLGNGYQLLFIAYQLAENALKFYPIGLDSFKMTNCYGDEKENVDFDFSCDFRETLCSWYMPDLISSTNSVWKITNTPSDVGVWHRLPEEDDFYIYVLSDTNSEETNQAVLTSLWHSPVDSSCLKITYRMFCRFGCSLSLDIEEKSLYSTQIMSKVDSQSNGWIEQFVNIKSSNEFRLRFNASANARINRTDTDPEDFIIALKSIKFDEGKECPVNGVCDFELDDCIWSLDGLERIEAAAVNIMSDHSLGVASGHILSLDQTQSEMRALINNGIYWTDKCLTFWTTPLTGEKDVISIIYNSTTLSNEYQITSDEAEMNSNSEWIYRRVNVQLEHLNVIDSGNLTIKFNIESDKDNFAIDDVSLHEKPCESPGSCSFEEDTCGWHNIETVAWLRNSGSTPSPYSGPDKDSSGQFGWYLFVDERELKHNNSAQIESERLSTSPEICLVFDYYLHSKASNQSNIGSIIVFIKEAGTLNTKIVDTIAPSGSPEWMKHSLSLTNLPSEYRIIFRAVGGKSESGDIAIDNIELLPGNCSGISSKTNPQKLFACNFDDGTLSGSQTSNMQISNGLSATTKKTPETDHTDGTKKGNYLLSKESQSFISQDITFINSSNVCFKFYYFIDSTSLSSSIKVVQKVDGKSKTLLVINDDTSRAWLEAELALRLMQGSFTSSIEIQTQLDSHGLSTIAIDDISIFEGFCSPKNTFCDFDSTQNCPFLDYPVQIIEPRIMNSLNCRNCGPLVDHTLGTAVGKYLLLKNTLHDPIHSTCSFSIKQQSNPKSSCLSFWFQMFGSMSKTMKIRVYSSSHDSDTILYRTEANVYNQWRKVALDYSSNGPHTVEFTFDGLYKNDSLGYITVDDIQLSDQSCSSNGVNCNFDFGKCSWIDASSDHVWVIRTPSIRSNYYEAPSFDVTTGSYHGSYLLLTGNENIDTDSEAKIESMPIELSSFKNTLTLSVFFGKSISDESYLTFQLVSTLSDRTSYFIDSITPLSIHSKSEWIKVHLPCDLPSNSTSNYILQVIGNVRGSSIIAIDDIELVKGYTNQKVFVCDGYDEVIPIDAVCDWKSDCVNGLDESVCGSCSFNLDLCAWSSPDDSFRWGSPVRGDSFNDDSSKMNGGYMITEGNWFMTEHKIETSNFIQHSSDLCTLQFSHYTDDAHDSELQVYLKFEERTVVITQIPIETFHEWTTAKVALGKHHSPFRIGFTAYTSDFGSILIDNIQFINCSPRKLVLIEDDSKDSFKCFHYDMKVPKMLLCDGTDDCGDYSDEISELCRTCLMTDFETKDYLLWDINRDWNLIEANSSLFDHTIGSDGGHYISTGSENTNLTSVPMVTINEKCSLRFYYSCKGRGLSKIQVYALNELDVRQYLWAKGCLSMYSWNRAVVSITSEDKIKFVIEVSSSGNESSRIAIDDISFSSECTPTPNWIQKHRFTGKECFSDQFKCLDGECISIELKGDYNYDCSDESDEFGFGPCDFEFGYCGWFDINGASSRWDIIHYQDPLSSSRIGYALSIGHNYGLIPDDWHLNFQSSALSETSASCEISFWYLFEDDSSFNRTLYLSHVHDDQSFLLSKLTKISSNTNQWTNVMIDFGAHESGGFLQFATEPRIDSRPVIDRIVFKGCSRNQENIDCDFNQLTASYKYCDWTLDPEAPLWYRHETKKLKDTYEPVKDHDGGDGYIYGKYEVNHRYNNIGRITSPKMSAAQYCFSFWYHIYGENIGKVDLAVKKGTENKIIWTRNKNAGRVWNFAEIEIKESDVFQLTFTVNVSSIDGIIALDDVKATRGPCKELSCEFLDDFCSWETKSKSKCTWKIESKETYGPGGPSVDHSSNTSNGNFAIATSASFNDTAHLVSDKFSDVSYRCLEWWYSSSLMTDSKASLTVHQFNSKQKNMIWKRSNSLDGKWRHGQVTLLPISSYNIEFIAHFSNPDDGYFALDDISIRNGQCSSILFCNFEVDTCEWTTSYSTETNDWIRLSGSTLYDLSGPDVDITTDSYSGFYLYALFSSNIQHKSSEIISPDLNFVEADSYEMTLWVYFDNGTDLLISFDDNENRLNFNPPALRGSEFANRKWTHSSITIEPSKPLNSTLFFSLKAITLAKVTISSNAVIALDDIRFTPKVNGNLTYKESSIDTEPKPTEPEITCTFETEACGWKYTTRTTTLSLEHASKGSGGTTPKYPANDHTTLTGSGYFTYVESDGDKTETRELLALEIDSVTAALGGCIKFWYYMFGSTKCVLSLFSETESSNQTLLWTRKESYIRDWNYVQVSLAAHKNDLKFFFRGSAQKCGISIDDVSFSVDPCPVNSICDFETDNCGLDNALNGQAASLWKRLKSNQINSKFTDHTYGTDHGTVMSIDNKLLRYGDYATLLVPKLEVSLSCISFAYLISDFSGHLSLQKKINEYSTEILWVTDYPSNGWEFIRLPFKKESDMFAVNLQFVYSIGSETLISSTIALDDIMFTSSCEVPPSCDFETDLCSWKVIREEDNLFYRGNGHTGMLSPSHDITLGTDSGHYLYIEQDKSLRGSAYLESPFIYHNNTQCLSLWLFRNGISSIPELDVILVSYDGKGEIVRSLVSSTDSNDPIASWFSKSIQINSTSKPFRVQIIPNFAQRDATLSKSSFLAIDSIKIFEGNCSLEKALIDKSVECSSTKMLIKESQVCDFIKDCPDGEDERNCGSSNFEEGFNGWIGVELEKHVVDLEKSFYARPETETTHKTAKKGKYLSLSGAKKILSPIMRDSSDRCFFSMYIFADVITNHGLQVFIEDLDFGTVTLIYQISQQLDSKWYYAMINIGRVIQRFRIIISSAGSEYSNIAIDDISFDSSCGSPRRGHAEKCKENQFYCSRMRHCIPAESTCDYRDDCGDGEDEQDDSAHCNFRPGRCDFEEGFCDWTIRQQNLEQLWIITQSDTLNFILPTRDHTNNGYAGHYALTESNCSNTNTIVSPSLYKPIRATPEVCRFSFYYQYTENHVAENILSSNLNPLNTLKVSLRFGDMRMKPFKTFVINATNFISTSFQRFDIDLDKYIIFTDFPFWLTIDSSGDDENKGFWSIDDVSFSSGCLSTECYKNCSKNQKCFSLFQRCDFTPDCLTGDDESDCTSPECSFDADLCNWSLQGSAEHVRLSEKTKDYPIRTDGSGKAIGGFVALHKGSNTKPDIISSKSFGSTGSSCTVSFSYYCSVDQCSLNIYLTFQNGAALGKFDEHIWSSDRASTSESSRSEWRSAQVFIGHHQHFAIQFTSKNVFYDDYTVALDNIDFKHCSPPKPSTSGFCASDEFQCRNGNCIQKLKYLDFVDDCLDGSDEIMTDPLPLGRCDFESECLFWVVDYSAGSRFVLSDASKTAAQPIRDHTTNSQDGNYLSLVSRQYDNIAKIDSPVLNGSLTDECYLIFWVNVIGNEASFDMRIAKLTNYSSSGLHYISNIHLVSFEDNWQSYTIEIPNEPETNFKIIIEGMVSNSLESSLNIDDITLTGGCSLSSEQTLPDYINTPPTLNFDCKSGYKACRSVEFCYSPSQECNFIDDCKDMTDELTCPSNCDFEKGMCGWSNFGTEKVWVRYNNAGMKPKSVYIPIYDHSKNSSRNYFLLASDNLAKPGYSVSYEIRSPSFISSSSRCILKFYFFQRFANPQYSGLRVYLVTEMSKEKITSKIFSTVGDQGDKWNLASVSIGEVKERFYIIIEAFFSYASEISYISVDDISFEDCESTEKQSWQSCPTDTLECDSTKCIPLYQLCDGSKDCFDESDESRCLPSLGDCDFISSDWISLCNWKLSENAFAWRQSNLPLDNLKSDGYIILDSLNSNVVTSGLIGPVFQSSLGECHMSLQYHIGGYTHEGSLEIGMMQNRSGYSSLATLTGKHEESKWRLFHWIFNSREPYQVTLTVKSSFRSPVAVDFIRFSPNCFKGSRFSWDVFLGYYTTTTAHINTTTVTVDIEFTAPEATVDHESSTYQQTTAISTFQTEKIDTDNSFKQAGRSFPWIGFAVFILFIILGIICTIFYIHRMKSADFSSTLANSARRNRIDGFGMTEILPVRSKVHLEPDDTTQTNDTETSIDPQIDEDLTQSNTFDTTVMLVE